MALILTEAGEGIGLGHFIRCSAIYDACNASDINCQMIVNYQGTSTIQRQDILLENWLKDSKIIEEVGRGSSCILVDSYLANEKFFSKLSQLFQQVMVIDDCNRIPYSSQWLINPNITGDTLNYTNQEAQILAGRKYTILRPAFTAYKKKHMIKPEIKHIFLTMGGTDSGQLLPPLIKYLKQRSYTLDVIAGSSTYQQELIQMELADSQCQIHGFVESEDMVMIMQQTDLAICGAGQTIHELACLGIPTIAIGIADNQELNLDSYFQASFLLEKLYGDMPDLLTRLENLLQQFTPSTRTQLSQRGQDIMDGKGAQRIAEIIQGLEQ